MSISTLQLTEKASLTLPTSSHWRAAARAPGYPMAMGLTNATRWPRVEAGRGTAAAVGATPGLCGTGSPRGMRLRPDERCAMEPLKVSQGKRPPDHQEKGGDTHPCQEEERSWATSWQPWRTLQPKRAEIPTLCLSLKPFQEKKNRKETKSTTLKLTSRRKSPGERILEVPTCCGFDPLTGSPLGKLCFDSWF